MVARSNEPLQSEAGYIDARPKTRSTNLLATHGRTIHVGHSRRTPHVRYQGTADIRKSPLDAKCHVPTSAHRICSAGTTDSARAGLVFTLPGPIADIAHQNKRVICDLLVQGDGRDRPRDRRRADHAEERVGGLNKPSRHKTGMSAGRDARGASNALICFVRTLACQ